MIKNNKIRTLSFRITEEEYVQFEKFCHENKIKSFSSLVRQAVQQKILAKTQTTVEEQIQALTARLEQLEHLVQLYTLKQRITRPPI